MNNPIVFKQSLTRLLFKQTVAFALVFSLGIAVFSGHYTVENWQILSLCAPILYFCGMFCWYGFRLNSNPNLLTIEITDQQIIGPQFWGASTVPVKEVDVAKSRRRGWIQSLLGRHWLRSVEDKGLFWFDDFVYGKGQFDRLLEIICQLQTVSVAQLQDDR
ncbi:MAG: hypothetical protein U0559_15865 [Anaerolineae bacterium]